jgi:hypothetical protein
MKVTLDIINKNLETLEKAKEIFPLVKQYWELLEFKYQGDQTIDVEDKIIELRREGRAFGIYHYIEFIEFIFNTTYYEQKLIYHNKIKVKEFGEILSKNAYDSDAKKSLKNKNKKTFEALINSKKWDVFAGKVRSRNNSRWYDNFQKSASIIANFCYQNEIEISTINLYRINKFYVEHLKEPDTSIMDEVLRTKSIVDFIIQKISDSGLDFRKVNQSHLLETLKVEFKNRILKIDNGETIKCINIGDKPGLTVGQVYRVKDKRLDDDILRVQVENDNGASVFYNFRFFETVNNLRNSTILDILSSED